MNKTSDKHCPNDKLNRRQRLYHLATSNARHPDSTTPLHEIHEGTFFRVVKEDIATPKSNLCNTMQKPLKPGLWKQRLEIINCALCSRSECWRCSQPRLSSNHWTGANSGQFKIRVRRTGPPHVDSCHAPSTRSSYMWWSLSSGAVILGQHFHTISSVFF